MSPEARAAKEKINKRHHIKLKIFFTPKETINKMKMQHTKGENIFVNDMSVKGLIYKIYEELNNLIRKPNKPIKKWAEDLNRHFFSSQRHRAEQQA